MEKILNFDKQGRLYIPEEMRKHLVFSTFVANIQGNELILTPIEEDPIEALSKLSRGKLDGKSIRQLKKEARKEIEENAAKKLRRH